jgi:Protein of unknown function (DUF3105)
LGQQFDPGRRATKAERKEEARLERDRIHRQMAARKRNRNIALVAVALAVVGILVATVLFSSPKTKTQTPAALLARAASDATASGCGAIQTTSNYQNAAGADPAIDHQHIGSDPTVMTPPPLSNYPTVPPASGPHDPTAASGGVYTSPPGIYQAIHSLEHAGAIIWYAPSAANSQAVKDISTFYRQSADVGQSKVIVAPYSYPDQGAQGQLQASYQMALVSWHHVQYCSVPSLSVAFSFTSQYSNAYPSGHYIGTAREPNAAM